MTRDPIEELFEMIKARIERGSEAPEQPEMSPMEQVARLRAAHQNYNVKHEFVPGQFVRFKDGLGSLKEIARPKIVLMYWRLLDLETSQDQWLVKHWRKRLNSLVDCVLMHWHPGMSSLIPMPADRSEIEPWTPPDTH